MAGSWTRRIRGRSPRPSTAILDAPAEERAAYGARGLAAAHATYNWESQMALLLAEYSRLTGKPW